MKKYILVFLIMGGFAANAQNDTIKNWIVTNKISLNFAQSYFSNWSAGGENTIATTGKYTLTANYTKDKHLWENWLNLALGYSYIGDNDPMKTDDKIEFISSYGYKFHPKLYAAVLFTLKTQFAKGYDYKVDSSNYISKFMAPGNIDLGPGLQWKPNKYFQVNFSPVTAKVLIVNDQNLANAGSFGLDPAEVDSTGAIIKNASMYKAMFGAKTMAVFQYEVFKNVDFSTKLELFSDYLDNPQNIDINWQVFVTLKVNSWLNVNINTELIYDDNVIFKDDAGNPIGPRTQFNENMQIGLVATF